MAENANNCGGDGRNNDASSPNVAIIPRDAIDQVAGWVSATVVSAFFSSLERFSCVNVSTADPDDDSDDDEEDGGAAARPPPPNPTPAAASVAKRGGGGGGQSDVAKASV